MTDFAGEFVSRFPRFADYVDADQANSQAELLRKGGLDVLNTKVLASPLVGVFDFVTEHNMAAVLLRRGFTDLHHEPPSMARPVDLVGLHLGRLYRVEVKRLAASEHDELHSTVMSALNRALESNAEKIVIQMQLRESFRPTDTNALIRHVKEALREPRLEEAIAFLSNTGVVASYTFHPDANATHTHVGILGDIGELRDVTGVDEGRVRGKVKLAYDKFKICPDDGSVHLLALEVNNFIDLTHIAGALYGQEYATFTRRGYAGSGRHPGGVFSQGLHSRLGGLVIARRAERFRLFCSYTFTLFENPGGALAVRDVAEALGAEKVLGPHDFP